MKTPIQELIKYLAEENGIFMQPEYWTEKEKAFAFECFEAGAIYEHDVWASEEDGYEIVEPNFDQFYSQYEQ